MEKSYQSQSNQLKTAVIYARYSSDNQTEQSIEGQLRVCNEYAEREKIIIVDTYIDRAMTGTNDHRPDFQRMIKDSAKRKWDYVLVYKLDRFSRNKYESSNYKHILKNNGVKVLSACEQIPETPEGIILESMLEGMNQYFSAELSQKVKRGMRETRLKGHFQGGSLLYGYKLIDKKIYIDEEKAEIVRFMFEQYANGVEVKHIRKQLDERGVTHKGKPFAQATLYRMLRNEKYIGIFRHQDEIFDNIYPQIISNELFEKVKSKQSSYKFGKKSVSVEYLFCRKIKCGYCGKSINADSGTSHTGVRMHYYKCNGRKLNHNCNKSTVGKDFIEQIIVNSIMEALSNEKIIKDIVKRLLDAQKELANNNVILNMLTSEKKKAETALDNLVKALERGIMSNTTNKRLNELENTIEELERKILIEKSKSTVEITEQEIRSFIQNALSLEIKPLINVLIKEIVLYDDKITVYYKMPNSNISPDESQGFCFYTEERNGYIIEMLI